MLRCGVDADVARAKTPAVRKPFAVGGEHVVVEPEVGAVRDGDGFVVVVERTTTTTARRSPRDRLMSALHRRAA
jgi:hypothetical protein